MDNFVSVILKTNELDENAIVEAMLDALDAPLAERVSEYGLFESENDSVVLRLQTPYQLDEDESDAFAQAFADRMFEMGYDDFDVEISLDEEPGDQRSQIGANNEKDFSSQLDILTKNKSQGELKAMIKAFSDRGDHIKAYMTAVRVQKVIGLTDKQLGPLKLRAKIQRDKNPDAMTSGPKAPLGDKNSTQSAAPNKQATDDPKANTSAPKRPGAPEDTKPPKIAGVQSNGKLTNFNIDKSLPSVDIKNIRTGENFRVYGPPANVEKLLARPEIEKVYSGRGDAGARQELELRKQQQKATPGSATDDGGLGQRPAPKDTPQKQQVLSRLAIRQKIVPEVEKLLRMANEALDPPQMKQLQTYLDQIRASAERDPEVNTEFADLIKRMEVALKIRKPEPSTTADGPTDAEKAAGAGQSTAQDEFEMDLCHKILMRRVLCF